MPGGIATFGKAFYLKKLNYKDSLMSIFVEKFFILWGIFLFASIALMMYLPTGMLFLALLVLIVAASPFLLPILAYKALNLKGSMIRNYIRTFPKMCVTMIIFQLITFAQYYIILLAFHPYILNFLDISIATAISLVTNTIPITLSGLGLRESATAYLLAPLGVSAHIAVATSLIVFTLNNLFPATIGAFLMASNKSKP
jgi:uncharacterized membrane protein YbhN (UPF0104 family)